nr:MAG: major capsid protein [Microvirus sp.]
MKGALHNLSHPVKLSMNQGELIPIGLIEALPADVMDHSVSCLLRTQPLVAPVMHEVDAKIHHWFVPTRTIWKDFPDFITGGPDGLDDTEAPYINTPVGGFAVGSLADYLGVTPQVAGRKVSALPFRAYAHIWNNYYRDQDLQTPLVVSDGNGLDTTTNTTLQYGCWEKDYFTSARATAQKGPAVTIPLVGDAPISGLGTTASAGAVSGVRDSLGSTINYSAAEAGNNTGGIYMRMKATGSSSYPDVYADLTDVQAVDINDLRLAAALQRYEENLSMYGSRYVERIMQAFGIRPRSLELDIPQYLGGGQNKVQISEVLATAESDTVNVGDLYGHGITAMRSNRYRYKIPEHGYIISLLIIRPRTNYIQGLPKLWSRDTKEDYYQPELENLGQQPILNKEIYLAHANPDNTFGFQDAYDSYRFVEGRVAGEFRDTLDYWHMARKFATAPALNADFVKCNATDRIYAVPAADQLYVMAKHKCMARRRVIQRAKPKLF